MSPVAMAGKEVTGAGDSTQRHADPVARMHEALERMGHLPVMQAVMGVVLSTTACGCSMKDTCAMVAAAVRSVSGPGQVAEGSTNAMEQALAAVAASMDKQDATVADAQLWLKVQGAGGTSHR